MKSKEIIIEESGIQSNHSKEMILSMINFKINENKLQYWSEWEGDHTVSRKLTHQKNNKLKEKKVQIEKIFKDLKASENNYDIAFSIQIKTEKIKFQKVLEYSE